MSSDTSTQSGTRLSQMEYGSLGSVAGTSPHIYQYNQQSQLRTSLTANSNLPGTSTVRVPIKNRSLQLSALSKSPGLTVLPRDLVNAKSGETGNQYISLPLRLENIGGSVQLVPAKTRSAGDQTSLIPVVVSGNEIYQIQGEGSQKNVVLLTNSQAGQSSTFPSNQNLSLSGLLSTSSKAEGLQIQVPKVQTGFQEVQTVTTCDQNTGNGSSQIMTGSVFSVPKGKSTQAVASPVYKSKLEKAMAQNLLMQSSAKSSINKTSAVPSIAHKTIPASVNAPSAETNTSFIKSDRYISRPIPQQPVPQYVITEDDAVSSVPSKSTLKVSKVAEYYKNFVAGKGMQQQEKQAFYQQPIETQLLLKTKSAPQYSIIPDDFHSNPKIMDVFSIADGGTESNVELEVASNQEFAHSSLPTFGSLPIEQLEMAIREKTYEDHCMGKSILEVLWSFRQDDLYCDAVLYAGPNEIKLHKIVLIGVSPEIQKRVLKTLEPELKLVLPGDMLHENIMTFLYYIYNGLIKLTLENVQQIYRLSGIFGLTQLSKHCYDFCKVAKMGHLIIGSPYQEAAKQIQKETVATELLPVSLTVDRSVIPTTVTTSTLLSSPKLLTKAKPPVKKESRENFETISSEIDWMTNDPSQSNIPIRKRGRNRKTGQTNMIKTTESETVNRIDQETVENVQEINNDNSVTENTEPTTEIRNAHPKKNEVNKFGFNQSLAEYEMFIANDDGAKSTDDRNLNSGIDTAEGSRKQTELIDDFVDHLTALPDPLVSGKLDENELLKLKETEDKSNKNSSEKLLTPHTPNKPEVRRFRARANISVVEAASQMKAKSNDMSTISSIKSRRKRVMKKSPTGPYTDKQTGSEIKRLLTNPTKTVTEAVPVLEKEKEAIKTKSATGQNILNASLNEIPPLTTNITKDIADIEPTKVVDEGRLKKVVENLTAKPGQEVMETDPDEPSPKYPSAPKKAKLRKSTMEKQELKDTVYMRPPPKKRTKEIREMMKNEEDGKLNGKDSEENSKTSEEGKLDLKEVGKENSTKKVKTKRKRPRVKNDIVMAKVYEIEKVAVSINSEKIYRCAFCSVEFKFAKRAVTHLIGTHDIDLDDTPDYVSVEKKTEDSKDLQECDICGFRPKESGTYYIHYHKYFRHQIPLPKGWQAYKCDLCHKEFFTKFQLREHKLIHFEDNPFVCEQCGSGFRSRTCLNSHVFHKHSSVRKHKCPECPKTFKTATQMKVHQRVHTGEKPFLCPTEHCIYRSTTRGNMKLHLTSKHKLNPGTVKSLMEALEASEVGPESLLFEESFNNGTNKQTLPREGGTESGPFDILVQTAALENSDVTSNREQYVSGQMEVITQDNVMVSAYSGPVPVSAPIMLNARDYSLVSQAAVQNQDLDMVMPEDNQMLENQNIPRHVEMLIQDAHQFMQHQDNPNQNQYVQDFQESAENEIQDMRNRLPDQSSLGQTYETPSNSSGSRFSDNSQIHGTHKILDPHSKEARMMIREAFEGHGSRSLLKSAILHGNQDSQRLEIGTRHLPDNSNISESTNLLNEAEKLVIDLHESGSHQIPLNQEDEVVQRLRSQIQQLRESNEQYRDSTPTALFRNEHSVPEILLQNITSQQQTMEPAHFQAYHHSSGSPPAYSSSSHGLITLPVSDIETQSNVTLTSVSQNETQGQIHSLQSLQGQGYTPVASQSTTNQYGPDGALYQGYYQEHYDIENY
ncbi:uncharacterized protein LOC128550100 [Mercenaria mercenaria]|uniref:uncharacterized protein LOC128550100 n=1 Tax=Mercenaria mercenaria TaxID=6596 RepID=UPI00234EEFD1|nr:uncharacterized protein LOC128550100 [Mercenaria mercenaria]XP_053384234.1 uncharacterized protein LOC128550100 [Mercenaria mercenaria]